MIKRDVHRLLYVDWLDTSQKTASRNNKTAAHGKNFQQPLEGLNLIRTGEVQFNANHHLSCPGRCWSFGEWINYDKVLGILGLQKLFKICSFCRILSDFDVFSRTFFLFGFQTNVIVLSFVCQFHLGHWFACPASSMRNQMIKPHETAGAVKNYGHHKWRGVDYLYGDLWPKGNYPSGISRSPCYSHAAVLIRIMKMTSTLKTGPEAAWFLAPVAREFHERQVRPC